jgi:hypothetical protein
MKLPSDAPTWLEPLVNELDARAREKVCNSASSERGAGYMQAVEDLKNEIDVKAGEERQRMIGLVGKVNVRG